MATIGTASRDYSTITAWEAALSTGAQTGECYDDSAFDESVTIDDTDPSSITLTVPASERHDGTAGSGARIVRVADSGIVFTIVSELVEIYWLEIDWSNSGYVAGTVIGVWHNSSISGTIRCFNMIVHDFNKGTNSSQPRYCFGAHNTTTNQAEFQVINCIGYNIDSDRTTGDFAMGIRHLGGFGGDVGKSLNNTFFNISCNAGATGYGVQVTRSAAIVQNTICVDCDLDFDGTPDAASDYNLSSDTTAFGSNSLKSKTSSAQFVSTTGGSEDLHLKSGADAIDAGTDLGTTPSGVEIDIDGRDRDANGDTWDIGAHEFVAAGGFWPFPGMAVINERRRTVPVYRR